MSPKPTDWTKPGKYARPTPAPRLVENVSYPTTQLALDGSTPPQGPWADHHASAIAQSAPQSRQERPSAAKRPDPVVAANPVDLALTEAAFQAQVVTLAKLCGWRVQFHWSERHSPSGWPDLTMTRDGRLVFAELKSERGRVSPDQRACLDALELTCAEVYLFRPHDWPIIEAVLK